MLCQSAKAIHAHRYWEVCRAVHKKEVCPVSASEQIDFLKRAAKQEGWWTLRLRAGSLLVSKFPNICWL